MQFFQKKRDAVLRRVPLRLSVSPQSKPINFPVMEIYVLHQPITKIETGCGRTACAEKRQRHAHNRQNGQAHSQIENCLCRTVTVFICTNPHRTDLPQYSNAQTTKLQTATSNTQEIVRVSLALLDKLFVNGYKYKRMGIVLGGLVEDEGWQLDLFDKVNTSEKRRLMEVTDRLNVKYGRNTVRLTIQGNSPAKPPIDDNKI